MSNPQTLDERIAYQLRALRQDRGWSLDALASRCGVSRATLSRLENREVSPTTAVLGKLCTTYSLTLSRLMAMVELDAAPLIPRQDQPVWIDREAGFTRRLVSPPTDHFSAEVLECELAAGTRLEYENPPRPGLEHHLLLLQGTLDMKIDKHLYHLDAGDCLRYRLFGASRFAAGSGQAAKYLLVII
jgi:transcriptional regulator with XRE-family HTH domain